MAYTKLTETEKAAERKAARAAAKQAAAEELERKREAARRYSAPLATGDSIDRLYIEMNARDTDIDKIIAGLHVMERRRTATAIYQPGDQRLEVHGYPFEGLTERRQARIRMELNKFFPHFINEIWPTL